VAETWAYFRHIWRKLNNFQGENMENKPIRAYVVDLESGEVSNTLYEGDKIIRQRSVDYLEETIEFNRGDTFGKIYTDILPEVVDVLTPQECKLLLQLVQYLRKDSGVLKFKNNKPVTMDYIINQNKTAKRTVERAMAGLREKDIVQSIKRPQGRFLLLNPYVVMNGRRIDRTCYDIFYRSRWAARSRNGND
jgi:hypothetical protein